MDIQPINQHLIIESPAYTKFYDKNGNLIEGISEPKIDPNHFRIWLEVIARDKYGKITGIRQGPANLLTNAFAAFVQAQILNQAPANTVKDTTNNARTITANTTMSALTGAAGTNNTTAAVTDYQLGTETETQATVTVNANPTTGTTQGSFTVTYTITAGADRAYVEVGLKITKQTWVFLITHDVFSVLNVSNGGTLAVTYTFNNS